MAHGVDSRAEDQIFNAGMAVRGHDHEVRGKIVRGRSDFMGRARAVAHHHIDTYVLFSQGGRHAGQIVLAFGNLGRGGECAEHLAGYALFDMQENNTSIMGSGDRQRVAYGLVIGVAVIERYENT